MKPEVTLKYLSYVANKNKKGQGGFTLIELLVVVIIIGVLAAVALPNLLGQVGKAREAEGKNAVGAVNRAQQGYHFERQVFADAVDIETAGNELGVVVNPEYYSFAITGAAGDSSVATTALDGVNDGVRNFAGSVAYAAGAYTSALCQSDKVNEAVTAAAGACTSGATLK